MDINKYKKNGKWNFGDGSATMVTRDGLIMKVYDSSGNQETIRVSPESLLNKKAADRVNRTIEFNKAIRSMTPAQFLNSNMVKGRTTYGGRSGYIVETPYGDRFIDNESINLGGYKLIADYAFNEASREVGEITRTRNTVVNAKPEQ